MKYYFAYGSNMDEERMKKRNIHFFRKFSGTIKGYKLVFQEFEEDNKKNSYANIIPDKNSIVEGIVYEVDTSINHLDIFECVPIDYYKEELLIKTKEGELLCFTYVGNLNNIGKEKPPYKEYINHLLKGEKYLSKKYFEKIKNIKTRN